ncbi:DUF4189 domain-containing protein [Lutibacter holmesii]|uniref:DUF4189 domain-containing protein n=1 Tax=Lutibacter holmesii TaxID=1137985 RepID=A0ABW3WMZ3_9FLAO
MKKLIQLKGFLFLSLFYSITILAQEGQYGSLAIDAINGNQYGWAVNYNTQTQANKKAISECEKNGGNNCHTVLWFNGGCAVYVVDKDNPGLYGYGYANTKQEAEKIARKEASLRGATNITVRVWGCNSESIKNAELLPPQLQGTFVMHFTKSADYKKAFLSNIYYEPNVIEKSGDSWKWTRGAQELMTPNSAKFMIKVNNDLFSYLTPKQRLVFLPKDSNLNWEASSEFVYLKSSLNNGSLQERKKRFIDLREALKKSVEADGYKIINIEI